MQKSFDKRKKERKKNSFGGRKKKNGMQKGILKGETKEIRKKKMKEKTK